MSQSSSDQMFELMSQGIWQVDAAGKTTYVNSRMAAMVGYSREDFARLPSLSLVREQDRGWIAAKMASPSKGVRDDYECPIACKDGSWISVSVEAIPIFSDDGQFEGTLALLTDVTERWQAEEALGASEEKYRRLFETMSQGVVYHAASGEIISANPAAERILGLTLDQMRGKTSFDPEWGTIREDGTDLPGHEHPAIVSLRTGKVVDQFIMGVNNPRTTSTTWISVTSTPLFRPGDLSPYQVYATFEDVTARKQAARNLSESEERFRSLVVHAPYCIHEIDLAGRLTAMNPAGLTMMGVDDESAIRGMPYLDAVNDGDRERIAGLLTGALAGHPAEFAFQGKTGLVFQSSFTPIADDAGRVRRLMGVTIDITAKKQDEAVDAFLAQAGVGAGGEPFFRALARFLAESLRTDYVCIDRLEGDALNATTLAVWHDGQFEDNLTYALSDTPCGEVVGQKVCCYPANVSRFFPNDAALQVLRAESYVGVTLFSHTGQPIGLIAVIGRQTLANRAHAETTLARVALRAAGELERLRVEDELRASEAQARAIIDASPVPMALNDEAANITYVNPAFMRTFGYTREDIPTLADWWPKACPDAAYRQQVAAAWQAELARSVRTGTAFEPQDLVVRCKDGKERFVVVNATSLWQNVTRLDLVVFHDLTERRRVEAARRLESAALEAVANAVMITDRAGVIVWANGAFTTMTGYQLDEAVGRRTGEVVGSGEHGQAFYQTLWTTILAGEVWRGEVINRRKDGSRYTEEMTITPLVDPSGAVTHFIAVKQDITQRKVLESQLVQAQKMESVGRLAGGVAHDFNNMLAVILGNVELAIEQVDPANPLRADLEEIRMAATRSADLTQQLLAFARKQVISPKILDLNATMAGMVNMLQRLIGENVHLTWTPGSNIWPVKADPSQIDQMLTNLCVNARDAIDDVGEVTIQTHNRTIHEAYCAAHEGFLPGEFVMILVSDDGCGMDKETLANAFEPFFTTKEVGRGTGLGLATVYGAVKQNNGFIDVTSEPGSSTTFAIYLPRFVASEEKQARIAAEKTVTRGHETILVVEDEPGILKLTKRLLARHGYNVLAASTPVEALRLAKEHAGGIDLLMTDVVMPEMNGRDLAKRLLSLFPALKCVFMSGYTADVIAHHGVLEDRVIFLHKPFSVEDLTAAVRAALDARDS